MSDEQALTEAVEAYVCEEAKTPGLVLVDFVVIAAAKGWNDDGDEVTSVTILPRGPNYAIRGLLADAVVRFDADTLDSYERDDP